MPIEHQHLHPSNLREQVRDLPPFKTTHPPIADDGRHSLPSLDPISRPSSTSTQNSLHHSASLPQLPGLSALASIASSSNSPQLRAFNVPPGMAFSTSSPSATSGGGHSNSPTPITPSLNTMQSMATMANANHETSQPTCQNCTTSTTPLWRRDEIGSVLCNACGLFLKLHGRPRPISLKTDVIKSRNRVKSSGSTPGAKKKNIFDVNGHPMEQARSQAGTPPPGSLGHGHRRTSQKSANGLSDGSNSPISRTATPSMYGNHLPAFNGHSLEDHYHNHSPSLPPMHIRQPSPGRSASPLNGTQGLEVPQTYEQLIASNAALKTRVSELEVINELFRGRVTQLEQDEANARRGEEMRRESEHNLLARLEESQRRENQLKRRADDMERELSDLRDGAPRAKKMRVADMVGAGDSESSTPQSVT
ncbi:GATA type zinc finger protein [Lachnellula suecica]|uniref:GATA type zinc finger protein n=1 Tax=Lachnellula suecica TaxID=602035 RepID=A0A8T9CB73_9HELO|nr:GATA type zinc finger protein [Lachnellula suecica]